jgi:hypothetical protein
VRAALTEMGVSVPPPLPPPPAVRCVPAGECLCTRWLYAGLAERAALHFTRASPQVLSGAISTLGASFCLFLCMYNVFFLYGSFIFTVHPIPSKEIRRPSWWIEKVASPILTDQTLNGVWSPCGPPRR